MKTRVLVRGLPRRPYWPGTMLAGWGRLVDRMGRSAFRGFRATGSSQ